MSDQDTVQGASPEGKRTFVRFTLSQRLEHLVQIFGFITLCVTGIPQKYNGAPWADSAIAAMGGIDLVRGIHRAFAVVLVLELVYHTVAIVWALAVKKARWSMMPRLQDAKDALQMVLFFVGVRKERARFDRYDFRQKVEYLALIWGTLVMIITGLCMWFPIEVTRLVSGELIAAAKAAHSGEGLLAFASILMWHMYSAHLSPDVFPFDLTMFTGKISEARMKHEHPIEYERIVAEERAKAEAAQKAAAALAEPAPKEA
jgi:cytochrome b subunit of formate dehydrogenase